MVKITLDGESVELRCTPRAARDLNAAFGDFLTAARRLDNFDLEAFFAIVAAGTGKTIKEVVEPVFEAGMHALLAPLQEYVVLLSHGGKMPKADTEGTPKGTGEA